MNLAIFGTGYVGLVSGVCFAEAGHKVICVDIDQEKITNLQKGISPIFEEGLEELLQKQIREKRITFTVDGEQAIKESNVIFSAVGTPPRDDGSADLQFVKVIAQLVGRTMDDYKVLVTKSTVPPLTGDMVEDLLAEELKKRKLEIGFDVVSNPEFLKEGTAVDDFMHPDRIVVGVNSQRASEIMKEVYAPYVGDGHELIMMDRRSAEIVKYAANAMLATRIAFMNEMSRVADAVGADVDSIKQGIGTDKRIGNKFLNVGPGFGGSCFPKDVKAISSFAKTQGVDVTLLHTIENTNQDQKVFTLEKIVAAFGGNVQGKNIAVWGLAFKAGTDDVRETPSEVIISGLINLGAQISAHDPAAIETFKAHTEIGSHKHLSYKVDQFAALEGAEGLVIMTEWDEYRNVDMEKIKNCLKGDVLCDMRNLYLVSDMENKSLTYHSIGRKTV